MLILEQVNLMKIDTHINMCYLSEISELVQR